MGSGFGDAHLNQPTNPIGRSGKVDRCPASRPARQVRVAAARPRFDQDLEGLADKRLVKPELNLRLQGLQRRSGLDPGAVSMCYLLRAAGEALAETCSTY